MMTEQIETDARLAALEELAAALNEMPQAMHALLANIIIGRALIGVLAEEDATLVSRVRERALTRAAEGEADLTGIVQALLPDPVPLAAPAGTPMQ